MTPQIQTPASETTGVRSRADGIGRTRANWVAAFTAYSKTFSLEPTALRLSNGQSALEIASDDPGYASAIASGSRSLAVLFDGVLYNRPELRSALGAASSDSALVLRAYERWGENFLRRLKGIFALVVWDGVTNELFAARDPLGSYPLFYASPAPGRLLLSTSIDALVAHPDVSGALNRAALADHLSHRWPDPVETFFEAVKRVPPGNRLRAGSSNIHIGRYWDPTPAGSDIQWVKKDELGRFDALLDEAVARCYGQGQTGIFLSGGFDSISIAAVAVDGTRRDGHADPIALSLAFPIPECNEETVQRGVAQALGLRQEVLPFTTAVSAQGLLADALDMQREWPAPIINTWMPAYAELAGRGKPYGVNVIITGSGGDEWLSVSPYLSADLIRRMDVVAWCRFATAWKRSYRISWPQLVKSAFWTYGGRLLGSMALNAVAPAIWGESRVHRVMRKTPEWVAPDNGLRNTLRERAVYALTPTNPREGFYLQEIRSGMEHSLMSMELEETFEFGRRLGVRILHPYWDADLVDMLYRTPPSLLNQGGRSKGLVRDSVAKRFPTLGFERQKKVVATSFYRMTLAKEGAAAWRRLGGFSALADLGIVDPRGTAQAVETLLAGPEAEGVYRLWDIFSLETWARARG